MKLGIYALVALLLGVGLGLGQTLLELSDAEGGFDPYCSASEASADGGPKVVAIGDYIETAGSTVTHNFDVMERNTKGSHTFTLVNQGSAPLELTLTLLTCKCTSTNLKENELIILAPSEELSLPLEWTPKEYSPTFRQSAEFTTNDPDNPKLHLVIEGRVTMSQRPDPMEITFADVPINEERIVELRIFAYASDDLKYIEHTFSQAATEKYFAVEVETIPTDELKHEPGAKSGLLVLVTKSADLPIGPFQQTLEFRTNISSDSIKVPIRGKVIGDIYIHTQATFDQVNNLLLLPNIKKGERHRAVLQIRVSGQYKDEVELSIDKETLDPRGTLVASWRPTIRSKDGPTIFPLVVEIPSDSEVVSRLGPTRKDFGKIVVNTTHPDAKQIVIYVRFAIEP